MFRSVVAGLLLATAAPAADPAPDPLRLVPAEAGFVLKVERPRRLAEAVTALDAFRDALALAPAREALGTTNARRFFQLVAHVERELGAKWPDLLDQLAGGGVAVGVKLAPNPAPALLVMQGTDEKQVAAGWDLYYRVAADELARTGAADRPVTTTRNGVEVVSVGPTFHAARVGAAVLVANNTAALDAALALAAGNGRAVTVHATLAAARKRLPADPLAWFWLDFAKVKQTKESKDFFETSRKDFAQTLVIGGTVDILRRSDYVCGGLYPEAGGGFRFAVRMPAGRGGFPADFAIHTPRDATPGSLPLLHPPGTLYTQSFYLDVATLWKDRATLVNEGTRRDLERADQQVSKFLPGARLGQLLEMWGPHHRVVVVNQDKLPYQTEPAEKLPAFGYVATTTDPQFGKTLDASLRAGGFLASVQYGLKLVEQTHAGVKVVGYRFPEDKPFPNDPGNARFNFEPCFAVVGDRFVAASTTELARKLIDELARADAGTGGDAVWRAAGHFAPAADALAAFPDAAVTSAILERGLTLAEARKEVDDLAALVRKLGTGRIEVDMAANEYRLDVVWAVKKD